METPDDDEIDRMNAEEEKELLLRAQAAGLKIREGFEELRVIYGHQQAWRYLRTFLQVG